MRLRLPIDVGIAVPPLFFWERGRTDLLRIRSSGGFNASHATTILCLELIQEMLRAGPCDSLLDVGCGSGVLALAAAFMGAGGAVGVDISYRAVRESIANAKLNQLEDRTSWFVGSTRAVRGNFQYVAANLRVEILTDLLEDLVRLTARQGRLILSGFHDIDWPALKDRCSDLGMEAERILTKDLSFSELPPSRSFTWCAVRLRFGTPMRTARIHVPFDDPPRLAAGSATEEEALEHYRWVRDEIRTFVERMPENLAQQRG